MEKKYIIDYPELMEQWDFEKNDLLELNPRKLTIGSNKKAHWICSYGHSWEDTITHRTTGRKCPYCSNRGVLIGYNDLKTTFPTLVEEWNYEKNINVSPTDLTSGSAKIVWWKCANCGTEWKTSIRHRTQRNSGCPICSDKQRVISRNKTLIDKNGCVIDKTLLQEWNYKRNGDLTPEQVTPSSNKRVWWICSKCDYEWQTSVSNRNSLGRGCPCCSNKVVVKGKNDLLTVNPSLAKEWHPTKNLPLTAESVTIGSGKKVWWICQFGHEYRASVLHRGHGTNCPVCNSGRQTSFAEQAIYYYVKKIFPDAINRAKKIIDNKMELDIYIPSTRLAIEYDGVFWHQSEKSKRREYIKYKKCCANGITLIRIREVEKEHISCPVILTGQAVDYSEIKAREIFFIKENASKKELDELIKSVLNRIDPQCHSFSPVFPHLLFSNIDVNVKRDENEIRSLMKLN